MELLNELVLPFNVPTKQYKNIFDYDNFDIIFIENRIKDSVSYGCFGSNIGVGISLSHVSHFVKSIYKNESGVYCDIEIIDTDKGNTLQQLINNGTKIVFRMDTRQQITYDNMEGKFTASRVYALPQYEDIFDLVSYYRLKKIKKLLNESTTNSNERIS